MIRVAFTGAQYTGKTTLATAINGAIGGRVPIYTDIPDCIQTAEPGTFDWTERLQTLFQSIIELPAFIFDRSPMCRWSFEKVKPTEPGRQWGKYYGDHMITVHEYLLQAAEASIRNMCLPKNPVRLVYVPIEFAGKKRDDPEAMQVDRKRWDETIQEGLKKFDISHLRVTGTVEERLYQVQRYLGL